MNFGEEYFALEIASSGVELINDGSISRLIEAKLFDGYHMPYPDRAFDLVILSHVLEHVEYERALLREIRRVGQYTAIEVPLDFAWRADERCEHFMSYGHINMYTPTQLKFLLKTESFKVLVELPSLYSEDLIEYSEFVNEGKERSPAALADFKARMSRKRNEFLSAETATKEFLADAYTVLCANHS
jgi:ubiquinone/menaquinone biosynthesis C-methylase UbiE